MQSAPVKGATIGRGESRTLQKRQTEASGGLVVSQYKFGLTLHRLEKHRKVLDFSSRMTYNIDRGIV
ncbi:MAG: hypothetical protein MN733_27650 [Nitrososphaera sp.]|nr:hypothetical protein [Nitrososphaera sp.]